MTQCRVAQIIEDVITGRVTSRADFAARCAELDGVLDATCAAHLHEAGHYLDDADIRRRDERYGVSQRRRLEAAIVELRSVPSSV